MLQIFNAQQGIDEDMPVVATVAESPEVQTEERTVSQTLVRQLHAETEKRFFLEEAIDLIDLKPEQDSSCLMNVLNLLNRSADTKQILIASSNGQLIESSFCLGEYQPELPRTTVKWLIDQIDNVSQPRNKPSIVRLAIDQETLTMPLLDQGEVKAWLIVIDDSANRRLKDQRSLFASASRLLVRLVTNLA